MAESTQKQLKTPTRSFYFIRHGKTDWNAEGRLQGIKDIPLNDTGREQAIAGAEAFAPIADKIDRIISSPLSRALETAEIIAEKINKPLMQDNRLVERDFGAYTGKRKSEVFNEAADSGKSDGILHSPSGFPHADDAEPYEELIARALTSVIDNQQQYSNEMLLICGHGGIFSTLAYSLIDSENYMRSENAVPYLFEYSGHGWTLHQLNKKECSHAQTA